MKKFLFYSINIAISIATIIGIVLACINLSGADDFHKSIKLDDTGSASLKWHVNFEGIYPGQSVDYTLSFENRVCEALVFEFYFEETGENTLAKFMDLEVLYNNRDLITNDNLETYFTNEKINFIARDTINQVNFKYTMPVETTNEAQGTVSDFDLNIKIRAQGGLF